jgi:hypothetical protein
MGIPSIFILFLSLVFVLQHNLRKSKKTDQALKDQFWSKEKQSLTVRKKSFSESDYIRPSLDSLNFDKFTPSLPADRLQHQQLIQDLNRLVVLDMMNFSHMSNSEIRIAYGTANQTVVTDNEEHYNQFLKTLAKYGHFMLDHEESYEAEAAFRLAIDLGSDYTDHYLSLATLYENSNKKEAIQPLIQQANELTSLSKDSIIKKLNNFLS